MFPRTECCENREDEKCECHAALPPGEIARITPPQQHPCHGKRGHGIWRTNDLHGFHEQARYIACWNWLPRKLMPKEMYGPNFFFSSRRRHTRFDCDWSSDVCSSD